MVIHCNMLFSFSTLRLDVREISANEDSGALANVFICIPKILTPKVVANLPPYFHDIENEHDAKAWFERVDSEGRVLSVCLKGSEELVGFLFASTDENRAAHIGYLLSEPYWGRGIAGELLQEFIRQAAEYESWDTMVGGVDRKNIASSKLLVKLGFAEQESREGDVIFYQYCLSSQNKAK